VFIEDNDEYRISPRAQFLIDEFGENKKVLSALSANMGSFCVFRMISATDSGRFRPPIPIDPGHPFRSKPATFR